MPAKDFNGLVFGRLAVVGPAPMREGSRYRQWSLRCICGKVVTRSVAQLTAPTKSGLRSCGCKRGEMLVDARGTHGQHSHVLYRVWASALDRCHNPNNKSWNRYGGRGIAVCRRWFNFENFKKDMLQTYRPGLTLERKNNNRGYSPANCEWVTQKVQMQNTCRNVHLDTPAGRMTLSAAAEHFQLKVTTLHRRIARGWPADRLFSPT